MRQRGLAIGLLAGMCVVGAGACQRNPATEYVAGFSTQVQVPREFQSLEVGVFAANSAADAMGVADCVHVPVVNGVARLPKTLGVHRQTDATNVMVSVIGFRDPIDVVTQRHPDCSVVPTKADSDPGNGLNARILRRSRQNYRDGKVLYLPMPLKYACFDVDCDKPGDLQGDQTCVAGKCISAKRHELVFREYSPDLAFGDSSACFSQQRCMSDAVEPKLEDADKCIYSVPGTGDGMNVRVIYDGFIPEMLDLDNVTPPGFDSLSPDDQKAVKDDLAANQEGFTLLGPGKFQLAPGLCELSKPASKGKHRILALAASRSCAPKPGAQPLCDEGSEVLIPASSRVYVLLDRSAKMQQFLGEQAIDQALGISLRDPVFSTTYVGFKWLPSKDGTACPAPQSYASLDVPLKYKALEARDLIIEELKKQSTYASVASTSLEPALSTSGVYQALSQGDVSTLNRQAVVIITNADVGQSCTGADVASAINAQVAAAAGPTKSGIKTYVLEVGEPTHTAPSDPVRQSHEAQANALAVAGGTDRNGTTYTATGGTKAESGSAAGDLLNGLIADLASCLYDRPASLEDPSKIKINYTGSAQEVPRNEQCNAANAATADGWNLEANGTQIRICGESCNRVHQTTSDLSRLSTLRKAAATGGLGDAGATIPDLPPALFVTATISKQ